MAACSSPQSLAAHVYLTASLGPSRDANGNNHCTYGSINQVLLIGNHDGTSVIDGQSQAEGPVHVICSVTGAYQVNLVAELDGPQAGRVTITGNVDGTTGGMSINGDLVSPGNGGEFAQPSNGCVITYMFANAPVPEQPVAKGRIWGHMSCPAMLAMGGQNVRLSDGTQVQETCAGEVDFRFEDCSQ